MSVSQEKSVQIQTTAASEGKKKDNRGRKPGSIIWTHEKLMTRSNNAGIVDKAKAAWLEKVYGVSMDENSIRVMILADHSAVKRYWSESEEFKAATADVAALVAEEEANKARAEVSKTTQNLSAETILAALTPEQQAAILALATKVQGK